jgi:hypothetical protein
MIWVWRATVEWYWQGKTEELGEKPVPVPLRPPHIPHGLTRSSAVRGRRQTTWAMARPFQRVNASYTLPQMAPPHTKTKTQSTATLSLSTVIISIWQEADSPIRSSVQRVWPNRKWRGETHGPDILLDFCGFPGSFFIYVNVTHMTKSIGIWVSPMYLWFISHVRRSWHTKMTVFRFPFFFRFASAFRPTLGLNRLPSQRWVNRSLWKDAVRPATFLIIMIRHRVLCLPACCLWI